MSKPLSELAADAREALDSMDDFARMEVGVDARGPRGVLDRFIAAAEALARRVEGAPTTQAIVAGWLAKAGVYDEDGCNESDVAAKQLRWCAAELVSDNGQRVRLVPEVGE